MAAFIRGGEVMGSPIVINLMLKLSLKMEIIALILRKEMSSSHLLKVTILL